ncbi:hypothetical protein V8C37DRAFT_193402 [Trichoderma ceciliae]
MQQQITRPCCSKRNTSVMWNRMTTMLPRLPLGSRRFQDPGQGVAWNFPDSRVVVLDNLCTDRISNQDQMAALLGEQKGVNSGSADSSPTAHSCFSSI